MGAHPAPFTQAARRVRERRAFFRDERQAVTAEPSHFTAPFPGEHAAVVRAGFGRGVAKGICGIAISFIIESFIIRSFLLSIRRPPTLRSFGQIPVP